MIMRLVKQAALAPRRAATTGSDAVISVLRVICALGMANALLMVIVTVLARRTPIALCGALGWLAVWWLLRERAHDLPARIRRRPALLILFGMAAVAPIAVDGGLESTLTTQAMWLTWMAAVTVSARATLTMAMAMTVATAGALTAAGLSVNEFATGTDRFQATLLIFNPVVVALAGVALVGVFRQVVDGAGEAIDAVRHGGAAASTPALTRLLHSEPPRLLRSPPPEPLTAAEAAVVAMLRDGLLPKQIALQRGTSLATVRTQIKHAKRKSGARTLNDLIRRTWPSN